MKLKKIVAFSLFLFYLAGYGQCGNPNYQGSPIPGFTINELLKENFGTMSTANGTTSVPLSSLTTSPTSSYAYYQAVAGQTPTGGGAGSPSPNFSLQDGYYTVFNNIQQTANFANGLWQTIGDHTNGGTSPTSGRMLIVNAGTAGNVYSKTISGIVTGVPLNVSLWAMNLDISTTSDTRIKPNLTITLIQNGVTVYSFQTGDIAKGLAGGTSAWKYFKNSSVFIPTSSANITLSISSNNSSGPGNDLAIDDILVYQYSCNGDADGDTVADINDLDDDNDGILDADECQSSNKIKDGIFPTSGSTIPNWTTTGSFTLNSRGLQFAVDNAEATIKQNISSVFSGSKINLNNVRWLTTDNTAFT